MKTTDFNSRKGFKNIFDMMDFCYKYKLTYENSLLEHDWFNDIHTLYFNT